MPEEYRLILKHADSPGYTPDIECYLRHGGYEVLKKALALPTRTLPDGRTVRYSIQPQSDLVTVLLHDTEGRLWVGHRGGAGLVVLKPQPAASVKGDGEVVQLALTRCGSVVHSPEQRLRLPALPGEVCQFTTSDGLAGMVAAGMQRGSDDSMDRLAELLVHMKA